MCCSRASRFSVADRPFKSPFVTLWRHSSSSPRDSATPSRFLCRASAPLLPPLGRVLRDILSYLFPRWRSACGLCVRTVFPAILLLAPVSLLHLLPRVVAIVHVALHQRCLRCCCGDALLRGLPHSQCIGPSVAVSPDPLGKRRSSKSSMPRHRSAIPLPCR
jgi:hypothetical protein